MATFNSLVGRLFVVVLVLPSVVVLSEGQSGGEEVEVKWGVADSTAVVGKLYQMHIPGDAFSGAVLHITVKSSDGSPLPTWMEFDDEANILLGIPTPSDVGQVFLDITAAGSQNQVTVTSTVFVRDVTSHAPRAPLKFKSSGPEFVWCKPAEPETVATVILDVDLDSLSVGDRLKLLSAFSSHMDLLKDMLKMTPVGDSPLYDASALVSGTGDSESPKTAGLLVSWPVGCGQVKEGHFPILQKLDDDSGSGKMARVLGHPVIGWRVTNSRFQTPTRKKRQVHVTPTPSLTPVMPTKTRSDHDGHMTHKIVDGQSPTYIQPTATETHGGKTDEPKVMPTETTPPDTESTYTSPMKPTGGASCVTGQQPAVNNKSLEEFRFQAGEVIDFRIPSGTFEDCEVGGTSGLHLILLREDDTPIQANFFVQLDSKSQRVIGLPMSEDAGVYRFKLVGKKSPSLMASTGLTIVVKDAMNREVNHEMSVTVDYDYEKFKASIADKVALANKLAAVYGDPDSSNFVITKIQQGSVIYGWTNSSVSTGGCPTKEIKALVRNLVHENGSLTAAAIEKLKPFVLLSAGVQPAGDCTNDTAFPAVVSKPRDPSTIGGKKDGKEYVAKGSSGGEDGDLWLTIVVPAVIVVVILIIALLIACILYRRKRKGKMNVEEQNTFMNKGKPIIFPNELEEKPGDVNKPLLIEGSPSAPPGYHRGASESPEPQLAGNYRNLSTSSPADDDITEMPEKPYEPPPPPASNNGKQQRPPHQQQPFTQAPVILP